MQSRPENLAGKNHPLKETSSALSNVQESVVQIPVKRTRSSVSRTPSYVAQADKQDTVLQGICTLDTGLSSSAEPTILCNSNYHGHLPFQASNLQAINKTSSPLLHLCLKSLSNTWSCLCETSLMQVQEHPHLHRIFHQLHPCNTSHALSIMFKAAGVTDHSLSSPAIPEGIGAHRAGVSGSCSKSAAAQQHHVQAALACSGSTAASAQSKTQNMEPDGAWGGASGPSNHAAGLDLSQDIAGLSTPQQEVACQPSAGFAAGDDCSQQRLLSYFMAWASLALPVVGLQVPSRLLGH